ncbi:hypothetical protein AN191_00745 [Loktanella sp. 5RATIMAR09]|nr:hypothetical protein AN191_00745 [Loktanella sp. 5RATIMAR09]
MPLVMTATKTILLSTVTALISTGSFAGSLDASQDSPEVLAPMSVSGADWSGAYVGGFLGAGIFAGTAQDLGGDALDADGIVSRLHDTAAEFGIRAGYNLQRGNFVYGGEIDLSGTTFDVEAQYDDDYRQEASTSAMLGITGRAGLTMGDTLAFVRGGIGFAKIGGCISDDEDSCEFDDDEILDVSETVTGVILGAGIEHQFSDALSMTVEVMQFESGYTDLISYDSGTDDDVARFSADSKSLRLGVNYSF